MARRQQAKAYSMISHIPAAPWKRNDPGTCTMQQTATRFCNSVLLHCQHSMSIHVVLHRCEGTDVFNHLLSGNLPHQVLQMLLLLPATNPPSCAVRFPSLLHSTVPFCFWLLQHIHAQEQEKLPPLSPIAWGLHLFCSCYWQIFLYEHSQWPCQTLPPPPPPQHLGQMPSLVFQRLFTENRTTCKALTRPTTLLLTN